MTVTVAKEQPTQGKGEERGAEKKNAVAQNGKGNTVGAKPAEEQLAPASKAKPDEQAGSTDTTAPQVSKPAAAQGNPGQNASNPGKEHPEQKAQGNQTQQVLDAGLVLQPQQSADSAQPTAKAAPAPGELHQSILSQVKDGVVVHDAKGSGQMTIRLNPEELGELKIQIRMDDGNRVKIEVQASSSSVKDLLMSNLDSLREALSGKEFSMERFDVSTGGGFGGSLSEQQGNHQQQSTPRFARNGGYGQTQAATVRYMTDETDNLLDVRL